MIYHILRFAFGDDVDDSEREEAIRQIHSLVDLDSTISSTVCQDLGNPQEGFTHTAIVILDSEEDYKTYLTDKDHAVIIEYVIPRFKRMMFCDAADDFDPGLYDRIQKTSASMDMPPDLRAHVEKITV